jgi:hypothetical protein
MAMAGMGACHYTRMRRMGEQRNTPVVAGNVVRAQTRGARHERGIAARAARRVQWWRWAGLLLGWQVVAWFWAVVITAMMGFGWVTLGFFYAVASVFSFPLLTHVLARPDWLLERQVRAGADVALAVGHLPPRLARLAEETRILRLAIETTAPDDPVVENLGWAWISMVRALGPAEAEVAQRLGVSEHEVIAVLLDDALAPDEAQGPGRVALRPARDEPAHGRRMELLAEHLEAFEVALLRHDPDPYRGS